MEPPCLGIKKQGFTLIELLVVLCIIGILAGAIFVTMGSAQRNTRDTRRISDLHQIIPAQEAVATSDGYFFKNIELAGAIPAIKNAAQTQYLATMADPINSGRYKYLWVGNSEDCAAGLAAGRYYCAIAKMEAKGSCAAEENRYTVVNQRGQKEICAGEDYVSGGLPACDICAAW